VYADVIKLYADGCILNENPIHITFVGEIALDQGGVQREMFAAFWMQAYSILFEGSNLLIPMIHPQMDMSVLPTIGRIISHGYLVAGILPIKIALPTLMIILLGSSVTVTNDVLLDTLFDYVTYSEKEIFQQALSMTSFPPDFQEKLIYFHFMGVGKYLNLQKLRRFFKKSHNMNSYTNLQLSLTKFILEYQNPIINFGSLQLK
jgi:hypothetical protein